MDELIKTVRQNKTSIVIALAILMFVAFGFCPAIDVAGKAKINGLKVLFEGSGLGFRSDIPGSNVRRAQQFG